MCMWNCAGVSVHGSIFLLKVDSVSAAVSLVPVLVFKANYQ